MIKKSTLLKTIIPLIMVLFFIRNLVLVETEHMDSWMGGGMRMFAKIDKMIYRVAGFEVNYNNKTYFVNLRNIDELEDEDIAARILPSEDRTNEILNKIKGYNWCYNVNLDKIQLKNDEDTYSCSEIINKQAITKLRVYATNFDEKSNKIDLKQLNQ
jgi:hypothetical protein